MLVGVRSSEISQSYLNIAKSKRSSLLYFLVNKRCAQGTPWLAKEKHAPEILVHFICWESILTESVFIILDNWYCDNTSLIASLVTIFLPSVRISFSYMSVIFVGWNVLFLVSQMFYCLFLD